MTEKRCHICGKEVGETYYLDKRGYTCYTCSKAIANKRSMISGIMTERFKITQNGDLFTVRDTVENKPMGVFEFKEDEFPVYFCFHKIIDLLNDLSDENEKLKQRIIELELLNDGLNYALKNIKKIDVEIDASGDLE